MNMNEEFDVEAEKVKRKTVGGFDGTPVDILTHEEKERIREMLAAGVSQKEISEKTGRSAGAIRKVLKLNAALLRTRADIKVFDSSERNRLIDLTFEKYEEVLLFTRDANSLRALIGGLKELCDIRRVEEGLTPSDQMHTLKLEMRVIGNNDQVTEDDLPDIVDAQFEKLVEVNKPSEEQKVSEQEYDPLNDV